VGIVIAEHLVERAAVPEQVDQEHGPRLRLDSRDLQRLARNVAEALSDDGDGGAIAEWTCVGSRARRSIVEPHGGPSKTQ
jgi:hypothetical protein